MSAAIRHAAIPAPTPPPILPRAAADCRRAAFAIDALRMPYVAAFDAYAYAADTQLPLSCRDADVIRHFD